MSAFDKTHKDILSAFIALKNKCFFLEKHVLNDLHTLNRNNFTFVYANSIYSHMRDVCDLSIVFMINEEISNITRGQHCESLLSELSADGHLGDTITFNNKTFKISPEDLEYSLSDIEKLMRQRINQIIGSHMLDFSISAFSAFEKWLTILYSCFASEFDKKYYDSRLIKAKKILDNYAKAEDQNCKDLLVERALKLQGAYISFPDKFNAILSKISIDSYPRDLPTDKKIVEFLRMHRNTVHNGGVHHGADISVEYKGETFSMVSGAPKYNDSWVKSIEFTGELVEIYTSIVKSIGELSPEAYCSFQEDELAILILDRTVQDFRHSNFADRERTLHLVDFLKRKFDLSNESATNFMAHLRRVIDNLSPDEEVNLFDLLTCDMSKST
ncbi:MULTISPECIES: hypothetical protein [Pseudomonas]|uniref:hypothetical protein n=1 Tax=Pseudomonas TaxID=286 RepID=UPI0015719A25|nr:MULTISPECIES: hypothetical protein [Pseudomonas]MBG6128051.1 hypothetical protein [Pseudomonas sp. M2]NSX19098.1 hypothetical protein [Pseudomonas putida]HDS1743926.1 hypothetical protein [Pseudomonas putida]